MDRQTLPDWVHRFNADGIEGLANKALPGRSPALSDGQMAELREIVLAGPDLAKDGVVRWRCCDLQGVIAERFDVEVHERTVGKLLRRLRLTRLQPRPHNPKLDTQAQEVFDKLSPAAARLRGEKRLVLFVAAEGSGRRLSGGISPPLKNVVHGLLRT